MGANAGNTLIQWEGYEATRTFAQGAGYVGGTDNHLRGYLHNVLGFSTNKRTEVRFSGVIPRNYTLGPVIFYWWYTMAYATGGSTVWYGVQIRRTGNPAQPAQAWAGVVAYSSPTSGAPAQGSLYLPQAMWPGEYFQFHLIRENEHVYSTSPGVTELLGAELREV